MIQNFHLFFRFYFCFLLSPQRLDSLCQSRSLHIQAKNASDGDTGSEEKTGTRDRSGCLGDIITDHIIQGDVGMNWKQESEGQIDRHVQPRGAEGERDRREGS